MKTIHNALCATTLIGLVACGSDVTDPDGGNEEEQITTVTLTFTPDTGPTVEAKWNDPDGEGGAAPTADDITLTVGSTYTVTLRFLNELETPAENITAEIEEEDDEHQVFFTGSVVEGPAATNAGASLLHSYGDMDAGGLAVGLTNTVVARSAGNGTLTVTLRHLPEMSGAPQKVASLASDVASGGIDSIAGDSDVSVNFAVTVQ